MVTSSVGSSLYLKTRTQTQAQSTIVNSHLSDWPLHMFMSVCTSRSFQERTFKQLRTLLIIDRLPTGGVCGLYGDSCVTYIKFEGVFGRGYWRIRGMWPWQLVRQGLGAKGGVILCVFYLCARAIRRSDYYSCEYNQTVTCKSAFQVDFLNSIVTCRRAWLSTNRIKSGLLWRLFWPSTTHLDRKRPEWHVKWPTTASFYVTFRQKTNITLRSLYRFFCLLDATYFKQNFDQKKKNSVKRTETSKKY